MDNKDVLKRSGFSGGRSGRGGGPAGAHAVARLQPHTNRGCHRGRLRPYDA